MSDRPMSVIHGRDRVVLQHLLEFFAKPGAKVLDVTANTRKMWKGVTWSGPVTYSDLDPEMKPDVVADFKALPFEDGSFDVMVFDPPHLPAAAASEKSMQSFARMYGLGLSTQHSAPISEMFAPFLKEANRVLAPDGLIFTKIKDYVHCSKMHWILVDWINAVRDVPGLTPCDLRIKIDPSGGKLMSSKWKTCHHARVQHTWWAITRKGKCVRKN